METCSWLRVTITVLSVTCIFIHSSLSVDIIQWTEIRVVYRKVTKASFLFDILGFNFLGDTVRKVAGEGGLVHANWYLTSFASLQLSDLDFLGHLTRQHLQPPKRERLKKMWNKHEKRKTILPYFFLKMEKKWIN